MEFIRRLHVPLQRGMVNHSILKAAKTFFFFLLFLPLENHYRKILNKRYSTFCCKGFLTEFSHSHFFHFFCSVFLFFFSFISHFCMVRSFVRFGFSSFPWSSRKKILGLTECRKLCFYRFTDGLNMLIK